MPHISLALLLTLLISWSVNASDLTAKSIHIKQIVIFGDSYSDNGNTYMLSKNTYPGKAYYLGHFLNGQNWAEYFSENIGIDVKDKNKFRNFAYGQAQIAGSVTLETHKLIDQQMYRWRFTIPDLAGEFKQYIHEGNIEPLDTVYFIFIGTNDFLNYIPISASQDKFFIINKLKALDKQVLSLKNLGATHIVIFNLRCLQSSPLAKQLAQQYPNWFLQTLNKMINQYNFLLSEKYKRIDYVTIYDLHKFDETLFKNKVVYKWHQQTFDIKEKSLPCYINKGNYIDKVNSICKEPWNYFYYDRIHPTTFVDKLMSVDLIQFLAKKGWRFAS